MNLGQGEVAFQSQPDKKIKAKSKFSRAIPSLDIFKPQQRLPSD
jgi:hypothetical protein